MATDLPVNKSVGSCPKDSSTSELENLVGRHESIWMGGNPDWATLQIHLGTVRNDQLLYTSRECYLTLHNNTLHFKIILKKTFYRKDERWEGTFRFGHYQVNGENKIEIN